MRLTKEWLGSAAISPDRPITAGEISPWTFTFTAGKYGIDDGGSIRLAWRSISDWEAPQFTEPQKLGYTTVKVQGKAKASMTYSKFLRPFGNSLLIQIHHGFLQEGDQVIITMGDPCQGSLGICAQTFCEARHEFRVYVDSCATNRYELLPDYPVVPILPAAPHEIQAILPGTVKVGQPFDIGIRALDEFGNPTDHYDGSIQLSLIGTEGNIPSEITPPAGKGTIHLPHCIITEPGIWQLFIKDTSRGLQGYSNPSRAIDDDALQLFWGDMHGQTESTVGTGSLDDYYQYARDKAFINFTGWQGNDFEITDVAWNDVREKTKKYNEEGKFLVYLGYEWSGITPQGGDHNVFFLHDEAEFHPSSNWSSQSKSKDAVETNPVTELCQMYSDRKDVILIPHVGGRYANLDYFDPEMMKVIEIHSHHGIFEWFALDAMRRRLKVGFIAASDDHTCRPGLSYPLSGYGKSASASFSVASGYTGVFAKELTKESVWDALQHRRCYASSTDRLFLDVRIGSHMMGEDITIETPPILAVTAAGRFPLEEITIFDWDKELQRIPLLPKSQVNIRIRWSGVIYKGRQKTADWSGMLSVEQGCIREATPYAIDRIDQGITLKTDRYITWNSSTAGDYDGVILNVEGNKETILHFHSPQGNIDIPLAAVRKQKQIYSMGGENLLVEAEMAPAKICIEDYPQYSTYHQYIPLPAAKSDHAYWIRVTEINGNSAWSSPIFVAKC